MNGKAGGEGAASSAMGGGCGGSVGSDGVDRDANGLWTSEENRNMPIELSSLETRRRERQLFVLQLVRLMHDGQQYAPLYKLRA